MGAAAAAGFSDSPHLSRVFESNFGLSPSALLTMAVDHDSWPERAPRSDPVPARADEVSRDEIGFGYNTSDALSASQVLADGYGQCNTKTTLLMALLRAVEIPCRFHGATIDKRLQKGVVDAILYRLAPRNILHSWAEVHFDERWVDLEGVILDADYLAGLLNTVAATGAFLGYGAGTDDIGNPPISWTGADTAIQKTGVNGDLGIFDDPDAFYREHGTNLTGVRNPMYQGVIRHAMNRWVAAIRGVRDQPSGSPPTPQCSRGTSVSVTHTDDGFLPVASA